MMNIEQWIDIGQEILSAPTARAGARAVMGKIPASALRNIGLARLAPMIGAPVIGAFAIGAAVGAGAVLFFAPGSDALRERISARLEQMRNKSSASSADVASHDDHDHDPRGARA